MHSIRFTWEASLFQSVTGNLQLAMDPDLPLATQLLKVNSLLILCLSCCEQSYYSNCWVWNRAGTGTRPGLEETFAVNKPNTRYNLGVSLWTTQCSSILKIWSKMIICIVSLEKSRLQSLNFLGSSSTGAERLKPDEARSPKFRAGMGLAPSPWARAWCWAPDT